MNTKMQKIFSAILIFTLILTLPVMSFGHSGRTDSRGGHHDYKNVSGLGSYHYHHGYGPHLHPGGVCPYSYKAPATRPSTPTTVKDNSAFSSMKLYQPSFNVFVNGYNLKSTTSKYYPAHINGIVYIPLSTEMIRALYLTGGWNSADGMNLETASVVYPVTSLSKNTANYTPVLVSGIKKPSFKVVVNGKNLNVTGSQYYPVVMNDIVYIPLTSEVITALELSGGWSASNGLVLNSIWAWTPIN